jgi:TRAP transporter TAXI family solute receptor
MMKRPYFSAALASAIGATALSGLPASSAAKVMEVVTFAVPPAGTSGYILTNAYAKTLREKTPIKKIVLQTFGGAAGWPARMQTGEVNFASHCGFKQIEEAYLGEGAFKKFGRQKDIRIMASGHGFAYGMWVTDPSVKTFKDLKGKRLFVLMTHRDQATAIIEAAKYVGLDYRKDMNILSVRSPREALQGLRTGRAIAFYYGMIPPLAEIKQSKGLHALNMSDGMIAAVQKAEPIWGKVTVKAGRPPLKLDKDFQTLKIACGVAAGVKTDPETVYTVTKGIFENVKDWNSAHPLARQWNVKSATAVMSAPYHEGAIRYFKEKGVWSAKNEADNKAWLAK